MNIKEKWILDTTKTWFKFLLKTWKFIPFFNLLIRSFICQIVKMIIVELELLQAVWNGVLFNSQNSYDDQRKIFISHCINYSKIFRSMLNLRKHKIYVITLLEGLKFFREEKENLDKKWTKLNRKMITMNSPNEMSFE